MFTILEFVIVFVSNSYRLYLVSFREIKKTKSIFQTVFLRSHTHTHTHTYTHTDTDIDTDTYTDSDTDTHYAHTPSVSF